MIMGMLGGIRMAALAAFETTAALKARGYPRFSMAGITTLPMAAASATDDPEISLWIIVATTVTMARPPRMNPTRLLARFTRRREIPDVSMRPPARMKRGMASRGKLEAPEKRFSGTMERAVVPFQRVTMMVVIVRPNPMGTLMTVRRTTIPRMSP